MFGFFSVSPNGFFTSVFSPARMLGSILLNLIPVCPQLLLFVWCDGVLTVLLIYSLVCTSASYQCDGSFLVAFMQLCEEMLEMIGMERIKCGFSEAFVHATTQASVQA